MKWYWANSARRANFFGIDAVAFYPFLILIIHLSWFTFYVALTFMITLIILKFFGITPMVAIRVLQRSFRSKIKYGRYKKTFFRLNRLH